MDILGVDLHKINFNDDQNFHEKDPDTIRHVRLLACCSCNKFEKRKAPKKRSNKMVGLVLFRRLKKSSEANSY